MGFFTARRPSSGVTGKAGMSASSVRDAAGGGLPSIVKVPMRFEAVEEALVAGTCGLEACEEVGRNLARDGVSLSEAMDGLRMTTQIAVGREPSYSSLQAMLVAWSEATLTHLHHVSCEDPLTGLASRAHVRSRIAELNRTRTGTGGRYALVVLDRRHDGLDHRFDSVAGLGRAMGLSALALTVRTVFSGPEVIARIAADRVVVLTERDERMTKRVGLLRRMLETTDDPGVRTRVWVEGLPDNNRGAAALLDDLARG